MKLYNHSVAPNPRRVRVFAAEKQIPLMLENVDLLAGDRFTIAEITALVAIDVAALLGDIQIAPTLGNLTRWHQRVSSRPSASA